MKQESKFLGGKARVVKDEDPMDVIQAIAKHSVLDEPFYVLNAGDIYQKIKTWRLKLPRVKMFYAVKCNNNKTVLEVLDALGVGFDCASKNEIQQVLSMGVAPSRIIFAHPCKPSSHLKLAAKVGVDLMTFDNEVELIKTKALMPNARLLVRIRCDAAKAQAPLGVKFGVLPENVEPLLRMARDLDLNIAGVAFHVGSGFHEAQVFERAIGHARDVFDLALSFGFKPNILDIGGGFPGHRSPLFDDAVNIINEALEMHFPIISGVQIIAEPGRYVVSSAFTLATSLVSKRDVLQSDGSILSSMYYINDGVYGSFNCILYDHQQVSTIPLKKETAALTPCSIWGPTCDGLDQILSEAYLPPLEIGDWLVWPDMGAYTIAAAGTFNGFPIPQVHVIVPYHTWLFFENADSSLIESLSQNDEERSYEELSHPSSASPQIELDNLCNVDQLGEHFSDHLKLLPDIEIADM